MCHLLVESPQFVTVPVYSSRGSVYSEALEEVDCVDELVRHSYYFR